MPCVDTTPFCDLYSAHLDDSDLVCVESLNGDHDLDGVPKRGLDKAPEHLSRVRSHFLREISQQARQRL